MGEPFAGPMRFLQGIRPGTVQLHDLGTVHKALTAVWHEVRLGGAPLAQGRRPLPCPWQVEDPLADRYHEQ
jgi:hypothetical protein